MSNVTDNHSQTRLTCERKDEHRPHQWGPDAGAFGGNWCPGAPDVTAREGRVIVGKWTGCLDSAPDSTWSCIEFDGTGLWCVACNQRAAVAT